MKNLDKWLNSKLDITKKAEIAKNKPTEQKQNKKPNYFRRSNSSRHGQPASTEQRTTKESGPRTQKQSYPEPDQNTLRFIPLGGVEGCGSKNMLLFEYADSILVVDMGLEFPDETMPGIDYAIPDISYLKGKEQKIKGIIVTHGHYDHTGAVQHLLPKLGFPPIYTTQFSAALIKKRLVEYKLEKQAKIKIINPDKDIIKLGPFKVEFFRVAHNIPDGIGLAITTPTGLFVHGGDFKFDESAADGRNTNVKKLDELGKRGVLAALIDVTNAEIEGHSLSEAKIGQILEELIARAKGRIVIGSFASLISRIQQVFWAAEKAGRKVYVSGRGMEENVEIARQLGYLKIPTGTMLSKKDNPDKLPDNKIIFLVTGSQGEEYGAFNRIANNTHKQIKIKKGDTAIISASVVPGNERSAENLRDKLGRLGAKTVYQKILDVHTGGHGRKEDIRQMLALLKPKYIIPFHGKYSQAAAGRDIATEMGIPEENIFMMEDGQILELGRNNNVHLAKKRISLRHVMVDGLGVGDVGEQVIKERMVMSENGMFSAILKVDSKNFKLIGKPQIITRGFIFAQIHEQLLKETEELIVKTYNSNQPSGSRELSNAKKEISHALYRFFYKKLEREPLIVVIDVKA